MTASREELMHLIEGLTDDQVEVLLADARKLSAARPRGTWPPAFVGMITDDPVNGSAPDYVERRPGAVTRQRTMESRE